MNPLASSITLSGVGVDDWVIISHDDEDKEEAIAPTSGPAPSYGERFLNNRYLETAVFGSREYRSGKFDVSYMEGLLCEGYAYLAKAEHEKVMIPCPKDQTLTGFFFGRYDSKGHVLPFDKTSITCLVLSGSFAPFQAYCLGIVEGYRQEGVQVLVVNYIGFGENIDLGFPSPTSVQVSSEAALRYLFGCGVADDCIIIHGYSLGGYPACKLAAKYNTHLLLDRASTSTEDVAYSMLQNEGSSPIQRMGAAFTAKLAKFGAPFSIKEAASKVYRKIFVVQEKHPVTEKIGALAFLEQQKKKQLLKTSQLVTKWLSSGHVSSPAYTWNVDQKKFVEKFSGTSGDIHASAEDEEARAAWQLFIQGIRLSKV